MRFIIEHLETKLYDWCLIEYEHISKIVESENLVFTNIKTRFSNKLKKYGTIYKKSIAELNLKSICVLSQYSKKTLKTHDKNQFHYFVFGGILGDSPAKKRTNELIKRFKKSKIKFETRNLGDKQMPTDVAVYVAKKILNGADFNEMRFCDNLEIEINENESVTLPFRYIVDNNKLAINEKLVEHLRKRKEF